MEVKKQRRVQLWFANCNYFNLFKKSIMNLSTNGSGITLNMVQDIKIVNAIKSGEFGAYHPNGK